MQTKLIKQKIKSVGNVKKITKTMELVSASKMKRAISESHKVKPFYDEAISIMKEVRGDISKTHPLLITREGANQILILIASNKGLCGSYHVNLYRELTKSYTKDERKNVSVISVGKYGEKIARRLGMSIIASHTEKVFQDKDARIIASQALDTYKDTIFKNVKIAYTKYTSATVFSPHLEQLLPWHQDDVLSKDETQFLFEPSEGEVLTKLIPLLIENLIFSCTKEAFASEHSARMFAMKNASDNASAIVSDLKLSYNRARQGAVTQEISEIVSGAQAQNQ